MGETLPFTICEEGRRLDLVRSDRNGCIVKDNVCRIEYVETHYIFRALAHIVERGLEPFERFKTCSFDNLGLLKDESRNAVLNLKSAKTLIRLLAAMGYSFLELYTEDTYEIEGEPYFGYLRGGYKKSELKELVSYAEDFGIEIVPCVQTLAHLNGF